MPDLCVIIPIYKEKLRLMEEYSIKRTCEILCDRDIFFVAPEELNTESYKCYMERYSISIKYFDSKYFKGIKGYNKLMLNKRFYQNFSQYTYMLIAQPDAFILSNKDEMDSFMSKGYQYWGAPWNPAMKVYRIDVKGISYFGRIMQPILCKSGNGGFSLRHINSTIELLNKRWITAKTWCHNYNEDAFFSYFGHSDKYKFFSCPTVEEASSFALEADMKTILSSGKRVFAVHAWEKMLDNYEELEKYIAPIN